MKERRNWIGLVVVVILAFVCAKAAKAVMKGTVTHHNASEAVYYEVKNRPDGLYLDTASAKLSIVSADQFAVETNIEDLDIEEDAHMISIEDGASLFMDDAWIRLTVPHDYVFYDVKMETGAGALDIESLSADYLDLDLGAGEVVIEKLNITKEASISTGAGRLRIMEGNLNNSKMDLGTGEVVFEGVLSGENRIDSGIGKVDLILKENDYQIELDCGLGEARLNGKKVDDGTYGHSSNIVNIDGGVGEITVITE